MYIDIISLLFLTVSFSAGILIRKPQNTAVYIGNDVTFSCASNTKLSWRYYSSHTSQGRDTPIYNGYEVNELFTERYSIDYSSLDGQANLVIRKATYADAGIYSCWEFGSEAFKQNATLVIIGGEPFCNILHDEAKEFQSIYFRCVVNFRGDWLASTRWRLDTGDMPEHNITENKTHGNYTSNSITLQVVARHFMNGKHIIFSLFFDKIGSNGLNVSENVPHFNWTWKSFPLQVQYGPKDITITPTRTSYNRGQELKCSADANPHPEYYWTDLITGNITEGPTIILDTGYNVSEQKQLQCTAFNTMSNNTSNITVNVLAIKSSKSQSLHGLTSALYIVLAAAGALLAAILVTAVVVVNRKRTVCHTKQQNQQNTSQGSLQERNQRTNNDYSATTSSQSIAADIIELEENTADVEPAINFLLNFVREDAFIDSTDDGIYANIPQDDIDYEKINKLTRAIHTSSNYTRLTEEVIASRRALAESNQEEVTSMKDSAVHTYTYYIGRLLQRAFQPTRDGDNSFTPINSDKLNSILFRKVVHAELWERPLENIPIVLAFFGPVHSGVIITLENGTKYIIHKYAAEEDEDDESKKKTRGASIKNTRQVDSTKPDAADADTSSIKSRVSSEDEGKAAVIVAPFSSIGTDWKPVESSGKTIETSKVVHFIEACGTSYDLLTDNCRHAVERMMKLK